jgi:hypothetical protein
MKYLRLSLTAFVLTLTLTGSAFAGDIQCPIALPSPEGGATNETVAEIALGLVQSVLSQF